MIHKDQAGFRETRRPETGSPLHILFPRQTFFQLIGEIPTLGTGKCTSLLRRADQLIHRHDLPPGQLLGLGFAETPDLSSSAVLLHLLVPAYH